MLIKDKTVGDLDKLLGQARGPHSRFEPTWHLNLAYYFGEQWLFWNRGRLDRPRLDPSRITITDNRIVGIVRTEIAKMSKSKPAFQVVPVTALDEDLRAAETGEKVLQYLWRHLDLRTKLEDVLLWSRICCAGFWKIYWDSARGNRVQVVTDQEGKPVMHGETGAPLRPGDIQNEQGQPESEGMQVKTLATGEVEVEVVSPFEIFPDPIARELKDAEWIIQQAVKSPDYIKAHYGVELEPDVDIAPGPTESRLFPSYQVAGTSGYKGVKLNEYWCKPNTQHPEGRRVVWAKGKILWQGNNPYKCLPYIMFRNIPVPGRFWPTSVTEQLRPVQTDLNKAESQIIENMQRIGNPALLCSRQADINYSGTPGERIDYNDTVANAVPSYLQPPNMPQYVVQQVERFEQAMEAIAGQHEVSNAQVPAGVKAASAINLLQEADDTRLGPAIYEMEEELGHSGEMLLQLVAQYWSDDRTIMVTGEDHALDAIVFRGAALKKNTQVEVQSGSAFPKSKAAKQAAIQDMLSLYFQYQGQQPLDKRMLGKVLKDLEAGGLEKLFGDVSVDESQINRENQILAQATPLPVNVFDNHEAHIEGHKEFQKGPTYNYLPEPSKEAFEQHLNEHRERILQKIEAQVEGPAAQQEQQQAQLQQGAPPSGNSSQS